ncbi:MAG: molybdopterin converting factor subunit 1 [Rhodospirillaceae bacterium]|jgi:molybdopterin synthase sulfur carrier subunit|nr:molybdopterin converting factor subunit 1 [Rhodospirillaceae bacterium]MBT3494448.1 molybdopterin converting factor subunit 1 [Rhodospirillaceae bacterium]MBT3778597.1 molybdopterin converting factor subunit 1 [Rhodospirillaceae bacterium]MBT3978521.1 molybdopterin converting factor subunit 1 [Rhodospirillaceae bacterium]MBT4562796.1 molybdopterin converting factor subunit 1 [Rhodospirillaceae bacterium]
MKLLYFAWLRDRVGKSEETVNLPASVTTVGQLTAWLARQSDGHAAAFDDPIGVHCAVNQEFARDDVPVGPDDEVAFFPPVTGGWGG